MKYNLGLQIPFTLHLAKRDLSLYPTIPTFNDLEKGGF